MKRVVAASFLLSLWAFSGGPAFGQLTDPSAGLFRGLKSREFETRFACIHLLGVLGPKAKPAIPNLIDVLRNDEIGEVRFEAAKALGQIGPEARAALPALREALKDPDHLVRVFVADALVKIDPEQDKVAVAALVECLYFSRRDPAEVPPSFVYRALGGLGPKALPAEPAVVEGLKERERMNRLWALVALDQMGSDNPQLVPLLVAILMDPHHDLLLDAAKRGGSAFLMPLLVGTLEGSRDQFQNTLFDLDDLRRVGQANRLRAATLLGKIGPKAAAAVPALEAAAQDLDPGVRKTARAALEQVRRKP